MRIKLEKFHYMVLISLLIAGFVFVMSYKWYGESLLVKENPVAYLEGGWIFKEQETVKTLTLPRHGALKVPVPKGVPYSIETVLPESFKKPQYLIIRGSLQRVSVFLEDQKVYERRFEVSNIPMASAWHFAEMPLNADGKVVRIEFESPFSDMSGVFNPIFYGAYGDAMVEIAKKHFGSFMPSFLIIVLGIVLSVFSTLFKLPNRKSFAYLGLFSISIGLWLMAESRYLQFFTGSTFYIGGSAYIFLSLMPIPLFIFIREFVLMGFKKYFNTFIIAFSVNTVFLILAQVLGFMAFYQSVRITHFLIFLGSLMLLIAIGYEIKFKHNREAIFFLKALMVLIIFGLLEMFHFYVIGVVFVSFFVRTGFLLFICMLLFHSGKNLVQLLKSNVEYEYYQKLAYEDRVTGGPNRTAFEEDFEEIFKDRQRLEGLRLLIFDLNQLKYINDTFGHVEGDRAIKMAYECISGAFGDIGKCYRIGGDEYACLIGDGQQVMEDYERAKGQFLKCVAETNKALSYPFGIAFGEVVYSAKRHGSVKEMMYFADQKMYKDKQKRKESKG